MNYQRNINYIMVGGDQAATTQTRGESLLSGEIAILNEFGAVLDNGAGATDVNNFTNIVIAQGKTGTGAMRKSDVINKNNVVTIKVKGYSEPTEQIDFIGYNGSSGAIAETNENDYFVHLKWNGGDRGFEFPQQNFILAHYKSDASASGLEVASNLVEVLAADARKKKERDFKAEITSNGNATEVAATDMIKLTKDSKTVSFFAGEGTATTGTIAADALLAIPSSEGRTFRFTAGADAHIVYIGDWSTGVIADAGTQAQNATAIVAAINADTSNACKFTAATDSNDVVITYMPDYYNVPPVAYNDTGNDMLAMTISTGNAVPVRYIVETGASSAASFTLTVPWQGETCYVAADSTAGANMFAATLGTVTSYGIKLTGKPRNFNLTKDVKYRKSRWVTTVKNFGSTTITNSQAASLGNGAWQLVAENELFGDIQYGNAYRKDIFHPRNLTYTECGKYGTVTIVWDDELVNTIGPRPKTRKQCTIYFNDQTATNATTFLTNIGAWMNTSYSF